MLFSRFANSLGHELLDGAHTANDREPNPSASELEGDGNDRFRLRLRLHELWRDHAAIPWSIGSGVIVALYGSSPLGVPAWLGFVLGFALMGGFAAWALTDPRRENTRG